MPAPIHSSSDTLDTSEESRPDLPELGLDAVVSSKPGGPPDPPSRRAENARVAALVKAHLSFVWRTLRRRGLSPSEADDGAQQVFLIVHRRIDAIVPGAEKAFLFRTAELVARDVHRARKRTLDRTEMGADTDAISSSGGNPEDAAERTRALAVLDELLSKLTDERRAVFVLFELEGLELAEIAAIMETPVGTVASRLQRARADFQKELVRYKAKQHHPGGSR